MSGLGIAILVATAALTVAVIHGYTKTRRREARIRAALAVFGIERWPEGLARGLLAGDYQRFANDFGSAAVDSPFGLGIDWKDGLSEIFEGDLVSVAERFNFQVTMDPDSLECADDVQEQRCKVTIRTRQGVYVGTAKRRYRDEPPHSLLSNLAGVVHDVEFLEVIAYRGTDTWGYVALAPSAVAELRANMPYFDLAFASIAAEREVLSMVSGD